MLTISLYIIRVKSVSRWCGKREAMRERKGEGGGGKERKIDDRRTVRRHVI